MKRLIGLFVFAGAAAIVMAMPPFAKAMKDYYQLPANSPIATFKCGICHTKATGGGLNGYGKDLDAAMKASNVKKPGAAEFRAIDGKDSDGDGKENGAEIKGGTNPGA